MNLKVIPKLAACMKHTKGGQFLHTFALMFQASRNKSACVFSSGLGCLRTTSPVWVSCAPSSSSPSASSSASPCASGGAPTVAPPLGRATEDQTERWPERRLRWRRRRPSPGFSCQCFYPSFINHVCTPVMPCIQKKVY